MFQVLCKSIVIILLISLAGNGLQAQNKFVGVKTCMQCHNDEQTGNQHAIWKNSKHSKTYELLFSARSAAFVAKRKYDKPAWEAEGCLKCHATAYNVDAPLLEKDYDVKDGVQCETCHGAGSEYISTEIMKDKTKAVAAGLRDFKVEGSIDQFCKKCHDEKETGEVFVTKTAWGKIAHYNPQLSLKSDSLNNKK